MHGLSMVEMMISITVGLFIIAALVGVVASGSRNTRSNDRTSELQTNGRYALETLARDLRHAGYRGYTWANPNTPSGINAIANECAAGFVINLRQRLWGENDANPFAATCVADYARGDMLVTRHVALAPATAPLDANTIYFRSAYEVGQMFQTAVPGFVNAPQQDYAVEAYVYYISPYTNSAGESPQIPALYRVALGAGPAMAPQLVASGIEHIQFQYGRATTDLNTRYYDADQITGSSTDASQTEWDDVNSVRIWLLARNSQAESGYTNNNTYMVGDVSYTVNDGFRRQLFTTVVELRN